jgi:uncharacterized protein (TIGR02145 family)
MFFVVVFFTLIKLTLLNMKNFYFTFLVLTLSMGFFSQQANAQAPQSMSYQSVIRNSSNALVAATPVGMQISLLQGTASGTAVYVETQTATTNANGLVSIEIGTGTATTGTFSEIDWATGPYFIKTEIDPAGGGNYTITGTQQVMSVPYALYAKTAENGITTAQANAITAMQAQITALLMQPTYPVGSVFCTSIPTLVIDVTNPTTGKTWMDRNLGATQVATSSTDAAAYGDLYQWGRSSDGHQCRNSPTTATLSSVDQPANGNFILGSNSPFDWRSPQNTNLWQGVNGVNNPCPSGYRLPTSAELDAERLSWSSNNSAGAFASPLKLPVAGFRFNSNGSLDFVGTYGFYWSGTVSSSNSRNLFFLSSDAFMITNFRALGYAVRCLKD